VKFFLLNVIDLTGLQAAKIIIIILTRLSWHQLIFRADLPD